jgi:hypothetical protein
VEIDEWGRRTDRRPALVNSRKLEICGQFCFVVRKPPGWRPSSVAREPTWQSVRHDGRRLVRDGVRVATLNMYGRRSPLRRAARRVPGLRRLVRALRRRRDTRP